MSETPSEARRPIPAFHAPFMRHLLLVELQLAVDVLLAAVGVAESPASSNLHGDPEDGEVNAISFCFDHGVDKLK